MKSSIMKLTYVSDLDQCTYRDAIFLSQFRLILSNLKATGEVVKID